MKEMCSKEQKYIIVSALKRSYSGIRKALVLVFLMLVLVSVGGCIKNDIPYPRIQPNFIEIDAEGLTKPAEIDSLNRLVTLTFGEEVDIHNVKITSYRLSPMAEIVSGDLDQPIDLSCLFICTLKIYQNYDWVIRGVQNIERYFTVENQIGSSVIDATGRRVVVKVPASGDGLKSVNVLTMKLGPVGSSILPDLAGTTIDLRQPVEVTVNSHGREEVWTIIGEAVEVSVQTVRADAWTQVAWVYGAGIAGHDNGVEYRQVQTEEWIRVPKTWLTETGGSFTARLVNLEPETDYEARAYSDDERGAIVAFKTGSIMQVPNAGFDEWSKSGKIWNPWAADSESYWDTGNKGATTLGDSNTMPTNDTSSGAGQAAKLETRFVGIGVVGKLAAGNIFAGSYVRTDGTNGILSFGRPFVQRPTKLRGYLKYDCAEISHTITEFAYLRGRPDTCIVWCALIDSPQPFEIRTNPSNRQLFNPDGSEVIAYGKVEYGQTVPQYIPFEFDLEYKATDRVPKYLLIVASASKYGDYFTGGNGSVLYLDDLELLYDYD